MKPTGTDLVTEPRMKIPDCTVCKLPVESVQFQWVIMRKRDAFRGIDQMVHTGEIIATISCHGETWSMSNTRGPLQPDHVASQSVSIDCARKF